MPDMNLTPGSWLELLEKKLDVQARAVAQPEDYYNGRHKLAFATAKFREAFSRYFPPLANNWMKLVVDTPVARLRIEGFRFNQDVSKPDWEQESDDDAWAIWQANNLDSLSDIAHTEAVKLGVVNLLISPPQDDDEPLITIEHPAETYVFRDPANPRYRLAAIKRWVDEDEYGYATVYMPDVVHKYRTVEKMRGRCFGEGIRVQWQRRPGVDPADNNPIGVVPMVPLENAPDLLYGGRSDLEVAMPIQDAVNKYCLDMQVSSEFHAFPQRWATGWDPDASVSASGARVDPSVAMGNSRVVVGKDEKTKFGEFSQGDVQNYIQPIDMYVDHLAAVTQTPAYFLKGKLANLSAEAMRSADAGLDDRCSRKIRAFSDGWEEALRVAFLAKGDTAKGETTNAEVIWADTERKSISQIVDAVVKMRSSLDVPLEMCWQMLGWSPQKIKQAKEMLGLPESPAAARKELEARKMAALPQVAGGGQMEQRPSGLVAPKADSQR